jgi:EAL domain-containing protein (putative c-di-GMP-specific phosphodiesterase class I)/CheY-like chemotaxis protein
MQVTAATTSDVAVEAPVILLVDDEEAVLRTCARVLEGCGYDVVSCTGGEAALRVLGERVVDTVVSDLQMPAINGLELLRAIRDRDLDVPVLLMTAYPHLSTAITAMEYGALGYIPKPFDPEALRASVSRAVRLHRLARLKREAAALLGDELKQFGDRASLERAFERALSTLWIAFQPLVAVSRREVIAYEALMRTGEASLPNPGAVLGAAERLGRLHELGRATRAEVARQIPTMPTSTVFVNLHAHDLLDEQLASPAAPLSAYATRVVFEITERVSLDDVKNTEARAGALRALGFRLAVDDLGAGYAGLTSFAQLEPDVVKFDMSLIRGVERSATRQRLVGSMSGLFTEMGTMVVAEGVETPAERDILVKLGCDIQQGYLYARPERGFPTPRW